MSKPFQRFRTRKSVTSSGEDEQLSSEDRNDLGKHEMTDQDYYDQATPDPVGDPFEQAKWFEELDIMN